MITRTTDDKARISLPKSYANSTLLIEEVSDCELRIRKAKVIAEDELRFYEETGKPLSDMDRDAFMAALDNPPEPSEALRKAASRRKKRG